MIYEESGRVTVKITMSDGRSDTFPMEFIPDCYLRGGRDYPGIGLVENEGAIANFTGESWVFEGIGYHYAEGKTIENTFEDMDDVVIGSWQILLDGRPTTYQEIEEIAFGLYTGDYE